MANEPAPSATLDVFAVPELLEMILVENLQPPPMLPLKAVCKSWNAAISHNPALNRRLYMTDTKPISVDIDPRAMEAIADASEAYEGLWKVNNLTELYDRVLLFFHNVVSCCATAPADLVLPTDLGLPPPSLQSWDEYHKAMRLSVWGGEAQERFTRSVPDHSQAANSNLSLLASRFPAMVKLMRYQKAMLHHNLRRLQLHPLLPVPLGPCLAGAFTAAAFRVQHSVFVFLPRLTLEILTGTEPSSPEARDWSPSWARMPVTRPPATSLLLCCYSRDGEEDHLVTRWDIVRAADKSLGVVFADLVELYLHPPIDW